MAQHLVLQSIPASNGEPPEPKEQSGFRKSKPIKTEGLVWSGSNSPPVVFFTKGGANSKGTRLDAADIIQSSAGRGSSGLV